MPLIVDGDVLSATLRVVWNTQFDRQLMESKYSEIIFQTVIYAVKKQALNNNSIFHKNYVLIDMR